MTTTDERTAGTALEQVAPGSDAYVLVTATDKAWALQDVLDLLAAPPAVPAKAPRPAPAETPQITEALRAALKRLPEVFGGVAPTEPRKLEQAELKRLTEERTVINTVVTALGKRDKAIDEAVRSHMDAVAREQGITGPVIADGVAKGHILAARKDEPFRIPVEGFEDTWYQSRTTSKPGLVGALLHGLYRDGTITRQEYLACTSEVRVLDEDKIRAAVKRNPVRFLAIIRAVTRRKPDGASLNAPKK